MEKQKVQCEGCYEWIEVDDTTHPFYVTDGKIKVICDDCLPF